MSAKDSFPYLQLLSVLSKINQLIKENRSVEETLMLIIDTLAKDTVLSHFHFHQITYKGKAYKAPLLGENHNCEQMQVVTRGGTQLVVEYCHNGVKQTDEWLAEDEKYFLSSLSSVLKRYLERFEKSRPKPKPSEKELAENGKKGIISSKFLHRFLNKNTYTRDVYHDLMPYKVKEILLISSLYDAYAIEREGRFAEHMLGQYGQLNLTSVPRITGASSADHAFRLLKRRHFDQIIYMVGVDKKTPVIASKQIKDKYPHIPIFLLLNSSSDVGYFRTEQTKLPFIDRVFTWNGDTNIFFSMIKLLEDKINVENDTRLGKVRVILLAEDSPMYSSRYLSFLYRVIMEQTKRIIEDVSTDALYKILRMRARPKILFASTFEQAVEVIDRYGDYLLCLITDVKYERFGKVDDQAGVELLDYARKELKNLPVVMQSSDPAYAEVAKKYHSLFIDKNSETLYEDLQGFITNYLGFGDFVFKSSTGEVIAKAANIREFEKRLVEIPDDSLLYHAKRNHFSMWLMARQEIKAANFINPKKVSDFKDASELRNALVQMIKEHRDEQETGNLIPYQKHFQLIPGNFYTLSDGSLGGKGRGLAFINALMHNYDFSRVVQDIHIKTPVTFIIGTHEFESFVGGHALNKQALFEADYQKIKKAFINEPLSKDLREKLASLLTKIDKPIAVRSSSLFEDSLSLPFAGIFETYILPNSHEDYEVRLRQLCQAVKLVYASLYSSVAKGYVKAIDYKLEDEKMAVVIEEVVGSRYGDYYYPHFSGVAQSYNYYPFAHMKPEEGFALAAIGLGKYVVEGNRAYRFSPNYPGVEINSAKDQFKNSQVKFYAVDLSKKDLNLLEGEDAGLANLDIDVAESHGTLKHCVSVYDPDNDIIYPGLTKSGPRIVNFANVLKYNYIPLAKTIKLLLELGKEAMGTAVEMEYAVDLNRDKNGMASFYILQIKPLISQSFECDLDMAEIPAQSMLLYTEKGLGNGVIDYIRDVIYIPKHQFDKSKTEEMAAEIERLNEQMSLEKRQYILIAPGRWGTRDKWIGIPVRWPQISMAKVIVETSLPNFPLDASSGSHFFHNVISMNVGYFTIQSHLTENVLRYELLDKMEAQSSGKYFRHVRFHKALKVKMDGKQRKYVIQIDPEER
jgi:hypothetical protein